MQTAPSAPGNLEAIDIQSNSIMLHWNRPIEVNAPSLTYQLWYNDKMIHIDNNQTMDESFTYLLDNLESFTNYTITVVACTRNCSQSSGSLIQRTKIGKPSRMNQISLNVINSNGSMELSWQKPHRLGGYLDFYLLNVSIISPNERKHEFYQINRGRNSCFIQSLNCDKSDMYSFSIKGVNRDNVERINEIYIKNSGYCFANPGRIDEKRHYYGDISFPITHDCRSISSKYFAFLSDSKYIFVVLSFLILCPIAPWILFNRYKKLQEMKKLTVQLPKGLFSNDDPADSLAHFDLIKPCKKLENINEESINEGEIYNNEDASHKSIIIEAPVAFNNNNIEHLVPLVSKLQEKVFIENKTIENEMKSVSAPTTPLKSDAITGYMQMNKPQKSAFSKNASVEGYLDMSGKSSNLNINNNNEHENPEIRTKDIKSFIQNSQLNNGYIQRKSVKESIPSVNFNGYVGFSSFKK